MLRLFILLSLFSYVNNLFAQIDTSNLLVASKGENSVIFSRGKAVKIGFKNTANKKTTVIRGLLGKKEEDSVVIISFKKSVTHSVKICIRDIEKIMILTRKGRKTDAWLLGGGLVYTGIMFLALKNPGPLGYVLFIPAIGAAVFIMYHYPLSWVFDLIRSKSVKNGWEFK